MVYCYRLQRNAYSMIRKKALVTGVCGQDGAYLAKLLLEKGYKVDGGKIEKNNKNLWRLKKLNIEKKVRLLNFELLDEKIINKVIKKGKYDEIYNLAAQSFVDKSFINPLYTTDVNALGVLRILEAIRKFSKKTKFFQASSSEMFGNIGPKIKNERTNFQPISPYAVSKLHAHWIISVYRNVHNIFCCSGIMFNHESPLREDQFVTQKIVKTLIKIKYKKVKYLKLGNIHVQRDWGYALNYVEAMWKMLQYKNPDDYIISTGKTYSVKTFVDKVAKYIDFDLIWKGKGINESGFDRNSNKTIIKIDKKLFRPNEINHIVGKPNKAKKILKWVPKTNIDELIKIMCDIELKKYKN